MNAIFFAIVLLAYIAGAINGTMEQVTTGAVESAASAVELAIGLVGVMALFLGLMQVMQEAGALRVIARIIRPVMVRLFPGVPEDHPAMGAMIMNLAANALGLANAATPFGIKAMQELDKLNGEKGTATNAMALFLAINTSAVTLLPTGVIGLRAAMASEDPAGILPSTLFASSCATIVGVTVCKLLERVPYFARSAPPMNVEGLALAISPRAAPTACGPSCWSSRA
jgi:spore maturation protein SpmA